MTVLYHSGALYRINVFYDDSGLVNRVTLDRYNSGPTWQDITTVLGQPINSPAPDNKTGNILYDFQGYTVQVNALDPNTVTWIDLKKDCKPTQ
jgi:hypothetical protein